MIGSKLAVQRPVVRSAVVAKPMAVPRHVVRALEKAPGQDRDGAGQNKEPFGGQINGQQIKPNDGAQEVPNPTVSCNGVQFHAPFAPLCTVE
jgi:hypothetical protein